MQITVEVPEHIIRSTVDAAISNAFIRTNYDTGHAVGAIKVQVLKFAQDYDYSAIIAELAPKIIREAVASELQRVIKTEVKAAVKAAKGNGKLFAE